MPINDERSPEFTSSNGLPIPLDRNLNRVSALIWVGVACAIGIALTWLFPDSCQQDGGYHFLFARWAWTHPELFVGVWARPLFTTLYAVPALAGYPAAKLLTVLIGAITCWQTYRLAGELGLRGPHLVVPFLIVQPSFFIISADTMTEPVFALLFVTALRLHRQGRIIAGMLVASLMILARPEGFFLGLLWAIWGVADKRGWMPVWQRLSRVAFLAAGSLAWWLAAFAITRDPLFILHNWPSNWPMTGTIYGAGSWLNFVIRLPEIVGPLLIPAFLLGLWYLLRKRQCNDLTSSFIVFFLLHTILRKFGLLGSAGYPRYFVAISPAIAVITLVGWNLFGERPNARFIRFRRPMAAAVLAISGLLCLLYFDGAEWIRDTRAVTQMHEWYRSQQPPPPIRKFVWSQAYMCIAFDRDPWENISFSGDRARDIETLRASPEGTFVFWDERFGPKWHGLRAEDFTEAGYRLLHSEEFLLKGYLLPRSFFGFGGPRRQVLYLFYK